LIATLLALVLNEQKPAFAFLLVVFVGAVIFIYLIGQINLVVTMLERLAINAHLNLVYVETVLKIVGIAYIAEFGVQIAKDAGQGALASKIELAGKILILVMAIPIITAIIQTVIGLIPQ
jgi:stage III sporulation protein AD